MFPEDSRDQSDKRPKNSDRKGVCEWVNYGGPREKTVVQVKNKFFC